MFDEVKAFKAIQAAKEAIFVVSGSVKEYEDLDRVLYDLCEDYMDRLDLDLAEVARKTK
jgi:hypothetical protein